MEDQAVFEFGDDWWDPEVEEQNEHLERVSSRTEWAIIRFCQEHSSFHADELRAAVTRATGSAAPASSDRILRLLRTKGIVNYVVVSRRESLYRVLGVKIPQQGKGDVHGA
jgi:hypothetical protein